MSGFLRGLELSEAAPLVDRCAVESYSVIGMPTSTSNIVQRWNSLPRPAHLALAVVFCAATTLYAAIWMSGALHGNLGKPHDVEIGINQTVTTFFDPATSSIPILDVVHESPAERAGLRAGDQMIGLNGHIIDSYELMGRIWGRSQPGDSIEITVRRAGEPQPLTVHAVFRAMLSPRPAEGFARTSARQVVGFYPIFFVLVGFAVLFLRLDDVHAWLLALLFAGFISVAPLVTQALPHALVRFMSLYRAIFLSSISAVFYIFFALFPEKSPLERRAPWLKWVTLAIAGAQIPAGLAEGDARLPNFVARAIGDTGSEQLRLVLTYSCLILGLISLFWNCVSKETSLEARRKSRVLLAGTLFGVVPYLVEHIIIDFFGYRPLFWVDMTLILLALLYPLSFAYAIVMHRVLEIPALLRRSARYVLVQRGYFVLLFCAALLTIFLFTHLFSTLFAEHSQFGMVMSAAFGVALVWVSGPLVKRGTDRIDRAFFRSSYDARMILQDLAEKSRSVADRQELATLLEHHLRQALHPESLAIYFSGGNGDLSAIGPPVPAGLTTLDAGSPFLQKVKVHGGAWYVPPPGDPEAPRNFPLAPLSPECIVPMLGHSAKLVGLLVLGQPLSEEPYSREDKRLLDSVAGQAAISLENMFMAGQIADRLELDRRAEREMQIARDVQARLFPQVAPPLNTLVYAGSCLQARQVGGDYYDFWDFGSTYLALVLADISGKGIAGALLMANLQANLRSRSAVARQDMLDINRDGKWLPGLLKSVNQFFYENTPDDRYATLFLAVYDDSSLQLEYANCGHNPPLLFRATGEVERLEPTATVIGISPEWECTTETITLQPNDVLVIYTDGVTEANDADANEFGEERLKEVVRTNFTASPADLLTAIQDAVQKFSSGEQFDDLTLVVARAR
jgi:sigma-B regulation protein RsbU (phosphoserine phosphatase)